MDAHLGRTAPPPEVLRAAVGLPPHPFDFTVALAMPVYRDVELDASESRKDLAWMWGTAVQNARLRFVTVRGQPVGIVRQRLVRAALTDFGNHDLHVGTGAPADIIVMQDTDVAFDFEDFTRLVRTLREAPPDVMVVGAPCVMQESKGAALTLNVFSGDDDELKKGFRMDAPYECAAIGFGLVAIRAEAFSVLPEPWFPFTEDGEKTEDGLGRGMVGEDVGFCDRLRKLGYKILAEPRSGVRHSFRRSFSVADAHANVARALSQ